MTRSLPPAQACGIASTTSASGYQWGPKAGPLVQVTTAPTILTTRPTKPTIDWPHGGKTPITCSTMSVPMVRMMPASMPASTAPMLRPIRRGGCVSFMTLSLMTPLLSPSRKLPATPRGSGLFVAQGFDGVELGGFHGRPDAEDETDADADDDASGGGPHGHAAPPLQGHADEQDEAVDEEEGDDAACCGEGHGFELELPGDVATAGAAGFRHPNFAGAARVAHAAGCAVVH